MVKFFGISEKPTKLTDPEYLSMAQMYWGAGPLPKGAKIIGGYSDPDRAGALIKLASGCLVCGNAGCISSIKQ